MVNNFNQASTSLDRHNSKPHIPLQRFNVRDSIAQRSLSKYHHFRLRTSSIDNNAVQPPYLLRSSTSEARPQIHQPPYALPSIQRHRFKGTVVSIPHLLRDGQRQLTTRRRPPEYRVRLRALTLPPHTSYSSQHFQQQTVRGAWSARDRESPDSLGRRSPRGRVLCFLDLSLGSKSGVRRAS